MRIILNNSSMVPIYEQLMDQIKNESISGSLAENEILPSVRSLSAELRISALTVKKAYDKLEEEGFVVTVHGKGTYVRAPNRLLIQEEQRRDLEQDLDALVEKAKRYGVSAQELRSMLDIITEE